MEVSITNMPADTSDQATACDVVVGLLNDIRESAYRYSLYGVSIMQSAILLSELTTSVVQT